MSMDHMTLTIFLAALTILSGVVGVMWLFTYLSSDQTNTAVKQRAFLSGIVFVSLATLTWWLLESAWDSIY